MPKLTTKKRDPDKFKEFLQTRHSFVFSCYHPQKPHIPETLLRELDTGFHLAHYSPSFEQTYSYSYAENKNRAKETKSSSEWLNLPTCSVFFLFLTPAIMTSLPHLMQLMDSQQDEQQPMPVIPFVVEPVDLNSQGEDYKDTLSALGGNLYVLSKENEYLCNLLRKIHRKLQRNSNYAGFGEDSVETLTQIQNYLDADEPVFTKELCYRVFRELINFMECNFVNLHFYTEETMSTLYEELVSRIHSSVHPALIPFDGSVKWGENVDLSQFHLVTPEECEMEGDVLLKVNSTHPKIALNFPIRAIGDKALSYSAIFEEIILPQGLEVIQNRAFLYNTTLRRIHLPQSVTDIGWFAFAYCRNLEEIFLPPYIPYLSPCLFKSCTSLKKIELPETLCNVAPHAFHTCVSLEAILLPEGLKELPAEIFYSTRSLKEITLPSTLKSIEKLAFYHSGITKIDLPDSLTSLGDEVFARCYELEEVTGNTSPEHVGEKVFEDCVKLKNNPLE